MFSCEICKIFKSIFFHRTPPVTVSEWTLLSSKMRNNKNQHDFCWFFACFKDIFDSRILFPELAAQTKHYVFGFDAIQFFLSNQCFCLLITTTQKIHISNETSQRKKNQLYKLKVLTLNFLTTVICYSYSYKKYITIFFLYSRIGYWGHVNHSISIL